MKKIRLPLAVSVLFILLSSCGKENMLYGTTWESVNSSELYYFQHLDGDFAEILKFDETQVHNYITRNGHPYSDRGNAKYEYDGKNTVLVYARLDTIKYTINGNAMYRGFREVFYKQ